METDETEGTLNILVNFTLLGVHFDRSKGAWLATFPQALAGSAGRV